MAKTTPISVRVPASLAWDCGSCGDCCRNFVLGPVDPSIISALEEKQIHSIWPPAGKQEWYHTRTGPDGALGYYLSPGEDGACIFLRDDQLCSIHATLGPEYKPAFCREYPYHGILDQNVLTLTARADCSNFHETFDKGTLVEDQAQDFAALSRPYGIRRFQANQVVVVPGLAVPKSTWTGLEADMLESLDADTRTPEESVGRLRTIIQDEVGGAWPEPNAERAAVIRLHLVEMLINALQQGLSQPAPDDPSTRKMKRILTDSLKMLTLAVTSIQETPPSLSDRSKSYFDIILRSNLMAKVVLANGALSAGLGLHLFGTHLVRHVATSSIEPLSPRDLGPKYAPWVRFIHNGVVQRLLDQAQPALTELFLVTPKGTNPQ